MELRVQGLSKSFGGRQVLKDLSFTAGPGLLCIMAPSGVGKTTLLRILLGLETPDSGTVTGVDRWAAVFQEDRLLEQLDAWGNLRFALGEDLDRRQAAELLDLLGLDLEDPKAVRDYSGGMKRRLALARCLLAPAEALALDEPFTGLDEASRERAMTAIRQYGAGKLVLLVTHRPEDAQGQRLLTL